jgi:hypothetical protein
MGKSLRIITPCVLLLALGACGDRAEIHANISDDSSLGSLHIREHAVTITRHGGPDAHISADGHFSIGEQDVAVDAAQREQLARYYEAATGLIAHGKAVGKAGAAVGVTAATEALSGLLKGDTSQIGPKVEQKAQDVKAQALKLCDDIATILAAQDSLSASLEAFRPYAVVTAKEANDCRKN